jgi:hypothetical protein
MPYGLATAGDVLTAANVNLLPRGRVAYAQVTASQTPFTTQADVTGLSVTFTAVSGRNYRTTAFIELGYTAASDLIIAYLTTGANAQLVRHTIVSPALVAGASYMVAVMSYNSSSLSGSTTHKLRLERNTGAGTLATFAAAASPGYIMVEDLGA